MEDFSSTTPPISNPEAEEAVICAVLIDPHIIVDLLFLNSNDFYIVRHRWVWETMLELYGKNEPIDFLTITDKLERAGKLTEMGGAAYISGLLAQAYTSLHAEAYAKMVHATGVRRRLLDAANTIAKLAYNEEAEIEDTTALSEEALYGAVNSLSLGKEETFEQSVSNYYNAVGERSKSPDTILGLRTGLVDLDRLLDGIKNKYYLFGGRPGDSKTSLMLNFTLTLAKNSNRVLYVSLEQEEEELVNLLASIESEIDNKRTNTGRLKDDEWPKFTGAIDTLTSLKDHIIFETRAGTIPTISARIDKVKPDVVIVDSLSFLRGHEDQGNESVRINAVGRDIKLMQRRINIPVLVVHHMSRAIEMVEREPRLADFNQGGEKDCDVAAFIRNPKDEIGPAGFSVRRITIVKHRGGGLGFVDLSLKDDCTRFYNAVTRRISLNEPREDVRLPYSDL